jgi:SSS family solute:Na+ symporter
MNLYIIILAIIVAALLAVSLSRVRTVKTKADFLVAGRSLPAVVLIFTLLSSWIGAGSLFAGAENAFKNGFAALWQPAGGWAGLLIIYFVAPRARKFAQFTIPDLLETRYHTAARVLGTIAILFAYTAITSYQFKGGGDILHLIFPGLDQVAVQTFGFAPENSHALGMIIIATFVIVFTALAGMASVAYMDLLIGLLITVTSCIAVPVLLNRVGGTAGLHAALPREYFQWFGRFGFVNGVNQGTMTAFTKAWDYFLPTFLLMLGNQSMYQKFFSAKTPKDARTAVVGWIIGTFVLETLIVAIAVFGAALFLHNPELASRPRETIPFTARHGLPSFIGALLMGAVFSKVISTGNNYLFSPATNLVNDVYTRFINKDASHRSVLLVSRVIIVLLGIFALLQGAVWASILTMALYAYTIYSAAITPVVMGAFFSKRVTAASAVTSIIMGTAVTIFWNVQQLIAQRGGAPLLPANWLGHDAIFPAVIISLLALVLVSLVTPAPRREQWAPFFAEGEPAEGAGAQR